ncbi:MAG: hypothetical protein HPY50_09025 [Firmicutes bacterium]|nr:hypothetical protein [Bacillota bacterium]
MYFRKPGYITTVVCMAFLLVVLAAPAQALVVDDGIQYNHLVKTLSDGKKAEVDYLLVDIKKRKIELKPVLAGKTLGYLQPLSSIAREYGAIAAINGSFYSAQVNLTPVDTTVLDQRMLVKSGREATAMIALQDRRLQFQQLNPDVILSLPDKGKEFKAESLNIECPQGLSIYTPEFGTNTKNDLVNLEFIVKPIDGKMIITEIKNGGATIPEGGFVISMQGWEKPYRYDFAIGDQVSWRADYHGLEGIKDIVTNGPRLVKNGRRDVPTDNESLGSLAGRNPRTAVGVTRSGQALLVTVDGRSQSSAGMTFIELADLMVELGASDAMALDGGGSTEMIVNGGIVNTPSDGRERSINNAILVISQIPVYLDGQRIYFETPPVNRDGRLLVPMRKLFEGLGAQVEWDENTRTVSAVKGDTQIQLTIGKRTAKINGYNVSIDTEATIINGRTMVPLRFVSQSLGAKVGWDPSTQTAYINQ